MFQGQLPLKRYVNKFGFNPSQLTVEQTIWTGSPSIYSYPPVATQMLTASTNSLDATTGMLTGNIIGLNSAWDWQEEVVTFSGMLFATTSEYFIRVFRFEGITYGSNGKNVGEITIGAGSASGGIVNSMYMHVRSGDGQSQAAFLTVPRSYTGQLLMAHYSSGQNDDLECSMYVRKFGSGFNIKQRIEIYRNTDQLPFTHNVFPPRSDFEMRSKRLSAGSNIGISGLFEVRMERTFRP